MEKYDPTSAATNSDADAVSVMAPVDPDAVIVVAVTLMSLNGGRANVTAVMVQFVAPSRASLYTG